MKIGVIIPDRNDRPEFLKNCFRLLKRQTIQPEIIELVNDKPLNNLPDITWRYRIGYERLRNKGLDVIALIENDDWYASDYLETIATKWIENDKPDIFGTNYTIYYNLRLHKYFYMRHDTRASAMNTLLKPDLNIKWCVDHEPFTDIWLWQTLKGKTFTPERVIAIGMKHGVGLCGGRSHIDRLDRFKLDGIPLLQKNVDKDSLDFYLNFKYDTSNC